MKLASVNYHLTENGRRFLVVFDLGRGRVTVHSGDTLFEHSTDLSNGFQSLGEAEVVSLPGQRSLW